MKYSTSEYLTAQFYAWEKLGRGWNFFDAPVELEPEFVPFFEHFPPEDNVKIDDGKRPRFFSRLQEKLGIYTKKESSIEEEAFSKLEEIYPSRGYTYNEQRDVTEFQLILDRDSSVSFGNIEQLLLMLTSSEGIVGFEIIRSRDKIIIQFCFVGNNSRGFKSTLDAFLPDIIINETSHNLLYSIDITRPICITELGLEDEFVRPLRVWSRFDPDPLAGCISVLDSLKEDEFGMIQVLFQRTVNPWNESMLRSVTDDKGGHFFLDSPEMLPLAKEKISSHIYAVVVRCIGQSKESVRSEEISMRLSKALESFNRTGSNSLVPLTSEISFNIDDIVFRRSRRTGMLLNSNELASMVHVPDRSITSPKLRQYTGKTKKAPSVVLGHSFELGVNTYFGEKNIVTLSTEHRLRHMHLIGATGTGKSSLLLKLIVQDIKEGNGIAVLDPHGDLIDNIIKHIPNERLRDVVLVDPSDSEYPIGLNLLSAYSDSEKIVLSSDLVALFRRFATSWGDQMTSVLANAINAILESDKGGTLIDLRRFLVETSFRNKFLESVSDPNILYYWKNEFPMLRKNTISPILTRLDTFLRPKVIRNMMAQKEGLDFGSIMKEQKVLLVKLSQGLIGEENSYLLGTLFVAKLHQAAQGRQSLSPSERKPFYSYIDEFQNFITPSMSSILSGARKYGLGLVLAHQDLDQLSRKDSELASSVLSNPSVRVCFRCGDKDASKLENGFSYFDSTDLQSLGIGQAIVRVGQKDHDFNMSFDLLPKIDESDIKGKLSAILNYCRASYAMHHSDVEDILKKALKTTDREPKPILKEKEHKAIEPDSQIEETSPLIPKEEVKPSIDVEKEAKEFVKKETQKQRTKEHRKIQEYIKEVAEARNFKAVIEQPVNDGSGMVDVSLRRDDLKIACEVSVTNTPEYEVQNIEKCFTARYSLVFMISNDTKHLDDIRKLASEVINAELHPKLFFVSQSGFINQLDLLLAKKAKPVETRTRGYRVKLNYTGSANTSGKQKALKDIIVSTIRRKKKKEDK